MKEKEDRRVKYTKALLKDALVDMMQTQHISKISVKALCDKADVHRSTFYAHYSDPYDLLRQIVDEVLQNVARYLAEQDYNTEQPVSEQNLRKILQYAQDNADVFKAMLSENSDAAIQRELMVFINDASFPIEIPFDAKTKEFISLFSISGVVSVLNKWLQDGMQEPIEQMAAFIMQILYRGLLGVEKR